MNVACVWQFGKVFDDMDVISPQNVLLSANPNPQVMVRLSLNIWKHCAVGI